MRGLPARVAIIGVGQVGGTVAYALLRSGMYHEILLVETNLKMREGQVSDLSDAAACEGVSTKVRAATYREAAHADIAIIAVGCGRNRGETSSQMAERSSATMHSIMQRMRPIHNDLIMIVVSNPVDTMTTLALQWSGLPATQVLGSGTSLDYARLRRLMSQRFDVASRIDNLYVLGSPGEKQLIAWSAATIDGNPLTNANSIDKNQQDEIAQACQHEAQHIFVAKGAITFGIASAVTMICTSIVLNRSDSILVSHFRDDLGCCLSMPARIGRQGISMTLDPVLSTDEQAALELVRKSVCDAVSHLANDE